MDVRAAKMSKAPDSLPLGWSLKTIEQIGPLQRGFDLPSREIKPGSIPIVYSNGVDGLHCVARAQGPGVITGRSGTLGKVHFVESDYWPHNTSLWVTRFNGSDPLFVFYLYESIGFDRFASGSGVPTLNRNDAHRYVVSTPDDINEQRAIATALSDADALVAGLERLIAKKRDIKQAAMQQLLTGQTRLPGFIGEWKTLCVGEFTDCTAGGTPSTAIAHYWNGAIPWMSSGELNKKMVHEVDGRITDAGLANSSTKVIPAKCVLIGLAGQGKTRGTVAINHVELCTNQSIAAIFPNSSFVPEYLYYNLDSRYDELRELSAGDGGRGGLNLRIIRSIAVPFPSIEEQTAIATVLSDMDAELSALEARLAKTRAIKQGMMQELLTGRTRLVNTVAQAKAQESAPVQERKANIHFMRSVLAAEIVDQLHDEPTFGHVKFEKMMFLVEHLCQVDTGSTYLRKAAGPLDRRALHSIDNQLRTQKWFDGRKENGRYRYVPLEKHGGHKGYFDRYFGTISPQLSDILDTFRTWETERCEIVATLFAAWNDLLREKGAVSDDMIVHEVLNNWHKDKQRIAEDRWVKALGWMRDKGYVPSPVANTSPLP